MDAGQQSQSVKLDVNQRQNRSCRKIALSLTMPESARHWAISRPTGSNPARPGSALRGGGPLLIRDMTFARRFVKISLVYY